MPSNRRHLPNALHHACPSAIRPSRLGLAHARRSAVPSARDCCPVRQTETGGGERRARRGRKGSRGRRLGGATVGVCACVRVCGAGGRHLNPVSKGVRGSTTAKRQPNSRLLLLLTPTGPPTPMSHVTHQPTPTSARTQEARSQVLRVQRAVGVGSAFSCLPLPLHPPLGPLPPVCYGR